MADGELKVQGTIDPNTCMSIDGMTKMSLDCLAEKQKDGEASVAQCIRDRFELCVKMHSVFGHWKGADWDKPLPSGTIPDLPGPWEFEANIWRGAAAILTHDGFMDAAKDSLGRHGITGVEREKFLERAELLYSQVAKKDLMVKESERYCPGLTYCYRLRKAGPFEATDILDKIIDWAIEAYKNSKMKDRDAAMLLAIESARNAVKKVQDEGAPEPWGWFDPKRPSPKGAHDTPPSDDGPWSFRFVPEPEGYFWSPPPLLKWPLNIGGIIFEKE